MRLDRRPLIATSSTVAIGSGLIMVLQQLAKHPERVFTFLLPFIGVVGLIYTFWAKRLR
jgi:hypothetical protein